MAIYIGGGWPTYKVWELSESDLSKVQESAASQARKNAAGAV